MNGGRVLLAISGGPDSIAMLRGLLSLCEELQLSLTVGHLNHQLRGQDSLADARWLKQLCEQWSVPAVFAQEDVRAIAERRRKGLEETARRERYRFLQKTAECRRCTHIAVAHTADDQAETILHHVLRGTGIAGLAGISRVRELTAQIQLVRPLLDITRAEVESFLGEIGQDSRLDRTNLDESFTRNRIRGSLLPRLRAEYNPQVDKALRRLGRQAEEFQELIDQLSARLLDQSLQDLNPATCRLDCRELAEQPRHLIRECFAQLWKRQNWPRQRMGFDEWERLTEIVQNGGTVTLPGPIEACRRGHLIVLRQEATKDG